MSLQVWLPLNGNVNNQGISPLTINSSNVSYKNGKTGQGLNLSTQINCTASGMAGATKFSVCFWSYCDADTSKSTDWCRLVFLYDATNVNTKGTGFRFETCYSSSLNSRGVSWHNNETYAISEGSVLIGGKNEWHHICVTCETGHIKTYDNGVLINDFPSTKGGHLTGQFYLGSNVTGCLNDFRLYDNVLSAKEVKEISKGLCLHYRLAGPGQANLLNGNIHLASAWTQENHTVANYSDGNFTGLKITATKANGRIYNSVSNLWVTNNAKYTVSFWAKSDTAGTTIDCSRSLADFSPTFTLSTIWKYYSGIITTTGTATGGTLSIRINQASRVVYIANIKVENGAIATPFVPPSNSSIYSALGYNNNIEYDCSGYRRNGIKNGTIICDIDSSRYTTSYHFSNSQSINYTENLTFLTTGSISFWAKFNAKGSSGWLPFAGQSGSYWIMATPGGTGNFYNGNITASGTVIYYEDSKVVSAPTNDGKWHHYVITGVNMSTWTAFKINKYSDSAWNSDVNYADIRIYNTILSAEDILELYNSPINIDNKGNLYAYEFIEEDKNNFSKQGIAKNSEFIDLDTAGDSYTNASISSTVDYANIFIEK